MEKGSVRAIALAYQTATLTYPSFEIMELLRPLPFERVLELLLIMRQSPRPVKSPLNFLRRAIQEGWSPETMPEKLIDTWSMWKKIIIFVRVTR